ncbi:MAG: hypothetical protein CR978_01380 [Gammaproteobacteria bacterium]|nr:MAG: hypothetical protein CR978_01380 [Gammaproteobacteria bacterium]
MAIGQIAAYRVDGLLASGAKAQVYLAYDERLERQVALKLILLPEQRQQRERVLQEARCLAAIDSSRVTKVYDVLYLRNYIVFVLQYVCGCTVDQLMRCYPISVAMAASIAADLSQALVDVHKSQIIHRDLKASNVFINRQGRAVLGDFGIAVDAGSALKDHRGSRACVSPEQYLGDALTPETDLFSLGVLLYRLLWGCHPFYSRGYLDEQRLLKGDFIPFAETPNRAQRVPKVLCELLTELLQPQAVGRSLDADLVARRLRSVCRTTRQDAQLKLASEAMRAASMLPEPEKIPLPFDLLEWHNLLN